MAQAHRAHRHIILSHTDKYQADQLVDYLGKWIVDTVTPPKHCSFMGLDEYCFDLNGTKRQIDDALRYMEEKQYIYDAF